MKKPKNIKIHSVSVYGHDKPAKFFVMNGRKYWKTDEGWFLKSEISDMGKFSDNDFYSVRVGG